MRAHEYPVVNNRLLFRCPNCDARRSFGVQSHVRRRSIRCHKCGSVAQCSLNRRKGRRDSQAGKCIMISQNGQEFDVVLHDISPHGLGFDIPLNAAKSVSILQQLKFKCSWNPRLLSKNRYIIRNINGSRIGAEKIT